MKKSIAVIVMLCLSSMAFAYQKGDVVLGGTLNTAVPCLGSDWGEFNVYNVSTGAEHDAKLGDPSIGFNLQALYFLSSRLSLGLSFGLDSFPYDKASGLEMNVATKSFHYMLLSRLYLNPQSRWKFYVPFALGFADTRVKIDMNNKERFNNTGFSASVGLGTETMLYKKWGVNFEVRYNYAKFHKNKFNSAGEYIKLYPQASYISYSIGTFYKF